MTLGELTCVHGDAFVVSSRGGDITADTGQGYFVRDTRFLDELRLLVDGLEVRALAGSLVGHNAAVFHGFVPSPDAEDPTLVVTRRRRLDGGLHDEVTFANARDRDATIDVQVVVGTDFGYIFDVKAGRSGRGTAPATHDTDAVVFTDEVLDSRTTVRLDGAAPDEGCLGSRIVVPRHGTATVTIAVTTYGTASRGDRPGPDAPSAAHRHRDDRADTRPRVVSSDQRLTRLVGRSELDLASLVMETDDGHRFLAAGSPWYLTLFGRDSIWAALMMLPFDASLATSTLHALASLQGRREDEITEEQPGRILHELRVGARAGQGGLPARYYGTIDATPLFVVLAHEAWRWGLPARELEPLLPAVERALAWLEAFGDDDGDGFIQYRQPDGRGLANQGWKDSHDGIRFADGRIARAPLALAEVQGYAYAAARGGAALLSAFGRPGADHWHRWADAMAARFRRHFWIADADGPYPAVALDGDDAPVDSVASNMGHLLFTGMLDDNEAALVADRLGRPDMDSGFGLRTLSSNNAGCNPLSYHCGSVWPHDTAITVWGLARTGHRDVAAGLAAGLVNAASAFDYRLPELYGGFARTQAIVPVPYPRACQPQAWSAGSALLLLRAVFGLEPDVPNGRIEVADRGFPDLDVRLWCSVGGRDLTLSATPDRIDVETSCDDLRITRPTSGR